MGALQAELTSAGCQVRHQFNDRHTHALRNRHGGRCASLLNDQRAGIEVETSLEAVKLPDATQLTVYRMVQEALTNIGKYAQARKVLVSVHSYPTHVAVQVRDDGVGFDPSTVRPTSHGLAGMRHRVESAGGRLSLTSRPGDGTLLSAVLPLQRTSGEVPKIESQSA